METTQQPVHLAGSVLGRSRHVCAFFHTRDEEYRVLLPFVKEGFARGDKAFHIVDPRHIPEHLQRLERAGVNVADARQSNQLEVRPWEQIHLREGRFDQSAMLDLIEQVLTSGKTDGFGMTRFIANMEWSLEERPGVEDIVEYESRLNYLLPKYDDTVICTYDLSKFSASVVIDILRTHPLVIIGGILQENPFFVPPDEFLQEQKNQKAPASAG